MQRLGWWLVGRQGREGEVFVCRENLHPSTISSGLLTVGGHHQGRTTQSCRVEKKKARLQMDVIVSSFLCNCSQSNKDTGAVLLRCLCWALYSIAINGGHLSLYTRFLSAIPFIEIVQNNVIIILYWRKVGMAAIAVHTWSVTVKTALSTTHIVLILIRLVNVVAYHSIEIKFRYYTNSKFICKAL